MEVAPGVGEARPEQPGELLALLVGETSIAAVAPGIPEVYLLMGHIHVAAHHHGLLPVKGEQVVQKSILPRHAVVQPAQPLLRIRRIDADQEKTLQLQRDHTPLTVMLLHAQAQPHVQRLVAREDRRARVALLLRKIPISTPTRKNQVQLPPLQLRFLQAEAVGIQPTEHIRKSLAHAGTQTVDIP